ncbi:MAG: flagellar hook capping FlgD N-terminal domain-containing protein [bacterium]|nr:flagellar hook capping FlgD N-terminal domain-containing protein [bacterium]
MAVISGVSNTGSAVSSTMQKMGLGKDDFLRLLTIELKNQNPLEPLGNKEFIAQMATFSQLEQLLIMSDSLTNSAKSSALSILGKQVKATTEEGKEVIGKAISIEFKDGKAIITLKGDVHVSFDKILEVAIPEATI